MKPRLIITAGDPLGIGPEIAVKAARSAALRRAAELFIVGDRAALEAAGWLPGLCPLLAVDAPGLDLSKNVPAPASGRCSYKAVLAALRLLKTGAFDALVTAPICKRAWELSGARFYTHTDLFRDIEKKELLMMFSRGKINVGLATEHLPLKSLPRAITVPLIIQKTMLLRGALWRLGFKNPAIGVCALNPHAGDGGLTGREELDVIAPALKKLKRSGLNVIGPCSPDAAWGKHLRGETDGLLCLYHDQALAPLKACAAAKPVQSAVHWTWGLPFIRTSPAHGTAFDIAGRGLADASGIIEAALFAARLVRGNGAAV